MELILNAGATPAAVIVALDRQERGQKDLSAIQEIEQAYDIPVLAIATLENLLEFARQRQDFSEQLKQLTAYRETYGI